MKNLESQASVFRTGNTFFKTQITHNEPVKKTFLDKYVYNPNLLSPKQPHSMGSLKYLDQLYRTRSLQRRPLQKQQFYPEKPWRNKCSRISKCSITSIQSPKQKAQIHFNRDTKTPRQKKIIASLKKKQSNEIFTTFYNTYEKSEHILQEWKDWKKIQQRSTSKFQNIMNRTITTIDILNGLKQNQINRRKGNSSDFYNPVL